MFISFIPSGTLDQPVRSDIMLNFGQVPRLGIQVIFWISNGTLDQSVKSKFDFEQRLALVLSTFYLCHHKLHFLQLSALSLLPTILGLVDRTTEQVNTHTLYVIQASSCLENEIMVAFFTFSIRCLLSSRPHWHQRAAFFSSLRLQIQKLDLMPSGDLFQICQEIKNILVFSQVWILQGTCVHARQVCISKRKNQEQF